MGKLVGSFGKFPWIEVKRDTQLCIMREKKREEKTRRDLMNLGGNFLPAIGQALW